MTPKETVTEPRKSQRRHGGRKGLPFIVEDHTDDETQAEIAEAFAMWKWAQQQRNAGHKPD